MVRTRLGGPWLGWTAIAIAPMSLIAAAPKLGVDVPMALLTFAWVAIANVAMIRSDSSRRGL